MFEQGKTFQPEMVREMQRRRDLCLSVLSDSPHVTPLVPDGGIHCILRLSDPGHGVVGLEDDEALAERILRETKVYTHPGYLYDILDETALVISFLKSPELLEEGLRRVVEWFRG